MFTDPTEHIVFFAYSFLTLFKWPNNMENIRVEAKVYTNQTSIFIVDCMKMPKTAAMRRCLQGFS